MIKKLLNFYKISSPLASGEVDAERSSRFKRIRWATFLSATTGYGIYYVCRLSMNVVRKPIVEEGVFSETQLGIIGSCLFFVYAVGKLTNGFLADRSNVRRFMSTGFDKSVFGLHQFILCLCRTLGIEWLVSVDGSSIRSGFAHSVVQ